MQCHLNDVHISEVPNFLAKNLSMTTCYRVNRPLPCSPPANYPISLGRVTSYFYVYSPSIAKYENEEIPKIHLTAKESPWDPSTNEYSKKRTCMLDHQGQISIPATVTRGPVFVSSVILYSLAYDATDAINNHILANALLAQINISIVLISMVK